MDAYHVAPHMGGYGPEGQIMFELYCNGSLLMIADSDSVSRYLEDYLRPEDTLGDCRVPRKVKNE